MSIQPLSLSGTLKEITQFLNDIQKSDLENGLTIEVTQEQKFKKKDLESLFIQSSRTGGFLTVSFNGLEIKDAKFKKIIDVMGRTLFCSARSDVDFANNNITDKGAKYFAKRIDMLRGKELRVYLMSNQIGEEGLNKIVEKVQDVYDIEVQVTNDKLPPRSSKFKVHECPIAKQVNDLAERNHLHNYLLDRAKSFKSRIENGENPHSAWEALNQDKENAVRLSVIQNYRVPLSRASSISAEEFQKQLKEVEKAGEARVSEAFSHQQESYLEDWVKELNTYTRYEELLGELNGSGVEKEIKMIRDYMEAANPTRASAKTSRCQSISNLETESAQWKEEIGQASCIAPPMNPNVVSQKSLLDMDPNEMTKTLREMEVLSEGLENIQKDLENIQKDLENIQMDKEKKYRKWNEKREHPQ